MGRRARHTESIAKGGEHVLVKPLIKLGGASVIAIPRHWLKLNGEPEKLYMKFEGKGRIVLEVCDERQ